MHILHVEDNPADVILVRMALSKIAGVSLTSMPDGDSALAHLLAAANDDSARPDLVLLDLNLPGIDGREVLARLKKSVDTRDIPVVILSSSAAQVDIRAAYDLQAGGFVTKPIGLGPFTAALREIHHYWGEVATLPERAG